MKRRCPYRKAIEAEVAKHKGVSVEFGQRSKHNVATITFNGNSKFSIYPASASDSQRGRLNQLSTIRKLIRELKEDYHA